MLLFRSFSSQPGIQISVTKDPHHHYYHLARSWSLALAPARWSAHAWMVSPLSPEAGDWAPEAPRHPRQHRRGPGPRSGDGDHAMAPPGHPQEADSRCQSRYSCRGGMLVLLQCNIVSTESLQNVTIMQTSGEACSEPTSG